MLRNDCIVRYRNLDQSSGDICLKRTQTNWVSSDDDMTSTPSPYCSYKAVSNSKEDINLIKIRQYSSIPIVLQSFQYAPSIHRVIIFLTNLSGKEVYTFKIPRSFTICIAQSPSQNNMAIEFQKMNVIGNSHLIMSREKILREQSYGGEIRFPNVHVHSTCVFRHCNSLQQLGSS